MGQSITRGSNGHHRDVRAVPACEMKTVVICLIVPPLRHIQLTCERRFGGPCFIWAILPGPRRIAR